MSNDIDYMISVMQAAKRGEEIEFRRLKQANWRVLKNDDILWNWCECQYRVKPKEPRVLWVVQNKHTKDPIYQYRDFRSAQLYANRYPEFAEVVKFVEVLE